jgi:FMN-dependent NADH-azoreductase
MERAMFNILAITSSLNGPASVSDPLVGEAIRQLRALHPGAHVVHRDLATHPVPHLLPETFAGVRAEASTPAEHAARALSDELIAEVRAADVIIIGAPMYNFSVPTTLRAWFDHVVRPRVTFGYDANGPHGLVENKPVIVIEARGGFYSEGPAAAVDFQEPYLRHLLGFIGITDVRFVRAEKIGYGPEARAAAIEAAVVAIGEAVKIEALAA